MRGLPLLGLLRLRRLPLLVLLRWLPLLSLRLLRVVGRRLAVRRRERLRIPLRRPVLRLLPWSLHLLLPVLLALRRHVGLLVVRRFVVVRNLERRRRRIGHATPPIRPEGTAAGPGTLGTAASMPRGAGRSL